jgi:hypothetical protein
VDQIVTEGQDEGRVLAVEVHPGLPIDKEQGGWCIYSDFDRREHKRVRLVSVVRLHDFASGEILALGLGCRISRESLILQQGQLQFGIYLALLRAVSLASILCLALPNLEAFSLARDARFFTGLNGTATPEDTLCRDLRWLRGRRRRRRCRASSEETFRPALVLGGRGRRL